MEATGKPSKLLPFPSLFSESQNSGSSIRLAPSEKLIIAVSWITAVSIPQLPFEYIDGNRVPTIVFAGRPSTFHAFLIALTFAFSGSFCALCLREIFPKIARFCRCLGAASMAAAAGILIWVIVLTVL